MTGYQYGGKGAAMTETEAAAHLRRNGISPALATSREARVAAAKPPALIQGRAEPTPPPSLKGAVKVAGFPVKSPYPFREIAADGGVWKLDPAAFLWRGKPTKGTSIRTAAWKWAADHHVSAKVVLDDGHVYVQFTAKADDR